MTLEELKQIIYDEGFDGHYQYNDAVVNMAVTCLDSAIKERDELKAKVEQLEILHTAFEESDYDLVTCARCGRWVLDLPASLSYCRKCAEKHAEEQEGGRE